MLNRLWQPVHVCSARRAFCLLFLDHAHVVHVDEAQNYMTHDIESWLEHSRTSSDACSVHSISIRLEIPRIIVLRAYDRLPKKEVKFSRQNIFQRDKFTCQYCGRGFETKQLNLDHVIPRDKGGRTSWENVVTSCIPCNTRKANKLPAEANMFPLNRPRAPRWRPFFATGREHRGYHESWGHFLDLKGQEVEMSA
ncbi:MAG: HNH endonuclease [Verrucomicrobiales bacterium]